MKTLLELKVPGYVSEFKTLFSVRKIEFMNFMYTALFQILSKNFGQWQKKNYLSQTLNLKNVNEVHVIYSETNLIQHVLGGDLILCRNRQGVGLLSVKKT